MTSSSLLFLKIALLITAAYSQNNIVTIYSLSAYGDALALSRSSHEFLGVDAQKGGVFAPPVMATIALYPNGTNLSITRVESSLDGLVECIKYKFNNSLGNFSAFYEVVHCLHHDGRSSRFGPVSYIDFAFDNIRNFVVVVESNATANATSLICIFEFKYVKTSGDPYDLSLIGGRFTSTPAKPKTCEVALGLSASHGSLVASIFDGFAAKLYKYNYLIDVTPMNSVFTAASDSMLKFTGPDSAFFASRLSAFWRLPMNFSENPKALVYVPNIANNVTSLFAFSRYHQGDLVCASISSGPMRCYVYNLAENVTYSGGGLGLFPNGVTNDFECKSSRQEMTCCASHDTVPVQFNCFTSSFNTTFGLEFVLDPTSVAFDVSPRDRVCVFSANSSHFELKCVRFISNFFAYPNTLDNFTIGANSLTASIEFGDGSVRNVSATFNVSDSIVAPTITFFSIDPSLPTLFFMTSTMSPVPLQGSVLPKPFGGLTIALSSDFVRYRKPYESYPIKVSFYRNGVLDDVEFRSPYTYGRDLFSSAPLVNILDGTYSGALQVLDLKIAQDESLVCYLSSSPVNGQSLNYCVSMLNTANVWSLLNDPRNYLRLNIYPSPCSVNSSLSGCKPCPQSSSSFNFSLICVNGSLVSSGSLDPITTVVIDVPVILNGSVSIAPNSSVAVSTSVTIQGSLTLVESSSVIIGETTSPIPVSITGCLNISGDLIINKTVNSGLELTAFSFSCSSGRFNKVTIINQQDPCVVVSDVNYRPRDIVVLFSLDEKNEKCVDSAQGFSAPFLVVLVGSLLFL